MAIFVLSIYAFRQGSSTALSRLSGPSSTHSRSKASDHWPGETGRDRTGGTPGEAVR